MKLSKTLSAHFPRLQKLVLRTNSIKILNLVYRSIYKTGINIFISQIRKFPQIKSVCLRRGLTTADWVPGSSDIDLFILIQEQKTEDEIAFMKQFWAVYKSTKEIFPFFGEILITTEPEFNYYRKHGGLRTAEISDWRLLYGRPLENTAPLKHTLDDTLTEIFNSFLIISNCCFSRNAPDNKETCLKAFADIMKYSFNRGDLSGLPGSRKEFIHFLSENTPNQELKNIINNLNNGNILKTLQFTIRHLDEHCNKISAELVNGSKSRLFEEITPPVTVNSKVAENKRIQIETKTRIKGVSVLLPAYSYQPSFMFVILNDARNIESLIQYLKYDLLSANHGKTPVILTKNMFNCLLNSLFFTSPFNYFTFKNEWPSSPEFSAARPGDEITLRLAEECAAGLALSMRMGGYNSNTCAFYVIASAILKLHLALEKKIIVSGHADFLIETYIANFPEAAQWLDEVKEYLNAPLDGIEKYGISDIFYRSYPYLKKIINFCPNHEK